MDDLGNISKFKIDTAFLKVVAGKIVSRKLHPIGQLEVKKTNKIYALDDVGDSSDDLVLMKLELYNQQQTLIKEMIKLLVNCRDLVSEADSHVDTEYLEDLISRITSTESMTALDELFSVGAADIGVHFKSDES
ncbi:MAG TPA: hypothetical protein EYM57_05380 [Gammaproteobacteria bacterium]|jgi:hypothetical protein|nr:hypothetical protein [Gammaproteobacteria bacterium]